jgi:hypothetical protein
LSPLGWVRLWMMTLRMTMGEQFSQQWMPPP